MENFTPPTQAELDEQWRQLKERDDHSWLECGLSAMNQAEIDRHRLIKEVEELRKEQRLSRCPFCLEDDLDAIGLKHHLLAGQCHPWNTTSSPWPAMQQKGEE